MVCIPLGFLAKIDLSCLDSVRVTLLDLDDLISLASAVAKKNPKVCYLMGDFLRQPVFYSGKF